MFNIQKVSVLNNNSPHLSSGGMLLVIFVIATCTILCDKWDGSTNKYFPVTTQYEEYL